MEARSFERGEIVYLTAELLAGGRIHEIGARADVRSVSGSVLELALGSEPETALCRPGHVLRASERRTRMRTPSGRWSLGIADLRGSRRPIASMSLALARVSA
jgi:hypothetical protein